MVVAINIVEDVVNIGVGVVAEAFTVVVAVDIVVDVVNVVVDVVATGCRSVVDDTVDVVAVDFTVDTTVDIVDVTEVVSVLLVGNLVSKTKFLNVAMTSVDTF